MAVVFTVIAIVAIPLCLDISFEDFGAAMRKDMREQPIVWLSYPLMAVMSAAIFRVQKAAVARARIIVDDRTIAYVRDLPGWLARVNGQWRGWTTPLDTIESAVLLFIRR